MRWRECAALFHPASARHRRGISALALFVREHPVIDEAGQAVGVEIAAQRVLIVILPHPVEKAFAAFTLARIAQEEGVQDAGTGRADMAEAQRELGQRRPRVPPWNSTKSPAASPARSAPDLQCIIAGARIER